jgi:hypothetical protein
MPWLARWASRLRFRVRPSIRDDPHPAVAISRSSSARRIAVEICRVRNAYSSGSALSGASRRAKLVGSPAVCRLGAAVFSVGKLA